MDTKALLENLDACLADGRPCNFISDVIDKIHELQGTAPHGMVLVPIEPSPGLLNSMAMRHDHAVFMPAGQTILDHPIGPITEEERQRHIASAITTMRQLHEEVVGTGFYRQRLEQTYAEYGKPKA